MARYAIGNDRLGVPTLTQVDTVAQVRLGTIVRGYDDVSDTEGEYIYARAGATITVGQGGILDLTNKVILADADLHLNSGKSVCVAVAATMADTEYGWFQITGKAVLKANAVVADAKVFLHATGGLFDDAAVAGCQVVGAEWAVADGTPAAGFAYAQIDRPRVQSQIT